MLGDSLALGLTLGLIDLDIDGDKEAEGLTDGDTDGDKLGLKDGEIDGEIEGDIDAEGLTSVASTVKSVAAYPKMPIYHVAASVFANSHCSDVVLPFVELSSYTEVVGKAFFLRYKSPSAVSPVKSTVISVSSTDESIL